MNQPKMLSGCVVDQVSMVRHNAAYGPAVLAFSFYS